MNNRSPRPAETIRPCPTCGFFATEAGCSVCDDPKRDDSMLCVIEQATDVLPLERSGAFRGRYHCLGGKLSPLDRVSPEDLRIPSLLRRIETAPHEIKVILALGSDVEGEATANYLAELLRGKNCRLTRIAQGLPAGAASNTPMNSPSCAPCKAAARFEAGPKHLPYTC